MNKLKDFISYLKIVKNLSENTIIAYKRDITELLEWVVSYSSFEDVSYSDFDFKFLENYIFFLANNGNSPNTRARKISSIKEFFKYLHKNGIISNDITYYLERPKIDKKVVVTLDISEVLKLIKQVSEHKNSHLIEVEKRNKAIIFLFLNCGLRKQEIIDLKLSDINLCNGAIVINGKGAKQRTVYINNETQAVLYEFLEVYRPLFKSNINSDYIFVSKESGQICAKSINDMLKKLLIDTELDKKGYTVHTLRKTCATLMYKSGEDIRTIQQVLGHSNIATTTIYVGVSEEMKQTAGRKNLW